MSKCSPSERRLCMTATWPGQPFGEAADGLRGEGDLRDEHDRSLAELDRAVDRGEIDLGLAAAGYALEEEGIRRRAEAGRAERLGDRFRTRAAGPRSAAAACGKGKMRPASGSRTTVTSSTEASPSASRSRWNAGVRPRSRARASGSSPSSTSVCKSRARRSARGEPSCRSSSIARPGLRLRRVEPQLAHDLRRDLRAGQAVRCAGGSRAG